VSGLPPLIVIAGATATGKTGLSIRLAEWLGSRGTPAEIVSADSRQVYRGLDIGTAKVSLEDRRGIPHHGLDLADPDAPFSVADYVHDARAALAGIADRGAVALLVGGTGLYLRALSRGLAVGELPSDAAIRARLEAEMLSDGVAALADRLTALAPALAATIDRKNPRRVVRALEIAEIQGDRPLPAPTGYAAPSTWIALQVEPTVHAGWIADRAAAQFSGGLLDEAAALRARFDPGLPAFSAIGYREAWAVLDRTSTIDDAVVVDTQRNVAFAKRQRTWFRAEPGIAWLDGADDPEPAARAIVAAFLDAG
jgi:tRNA dimethylallyltransferase